MQRTIYEESDIKALSALLMARKLPVTVTIKQGKPKTNPQNRLQRQWMNDAEEQLRTDTAEGFRGYCKLHFGIPILRNSSDEFCAQYDEVIRPLPYELKLKLMQVPFDFGVTRLMTAPQKTQYLDRVSAHFRGLGVVLTDPEARKYEREMA